MAAVTTKLFSRRALLHGGAMAAVSTAAFGATPSAVDVAVIGGGVSGCYAGRRLKLASPGARVALFEMSGRIGGRLHSYRFASAPHVVAEVGGMRFLADHKMVQSLIPRFNLVACQRTIRRPSGT